MNDYEEKRESIPMWDGQASTLDTFAEDVELYVAGLKADQRALAGPRIARAHPPDSAQRKLATGLGMESLSAADGAAKIVAAFKASLSDKTEQEVWNHLRTYLYQTYRMRYETMPSYILREEILHQKAVKALRVLTETCSTSCTTPFGPSLSSRTPASTQRTGSAF